MAPGRKVSAPVGGGEDPDGRKAGSQVSVAQENAFVAVGSNIDPRQHIIEALSRLRERARVTATSTFYWTAALDRPEQPRFANGVWQVETDLPARRLKFDVLRIIERQLGRVRTADRYASRTIDLDVVLCGDLVVDEPDLRIPDPDIRTRPFISIPLLELAPDLILPDTGEPLAALPVVADRAGMEADPDFTAQIRTILSR